MNVNMKITDSDSDRQRLFATSLSIIIAIILFIIKAYAYAITGSQAILSDAMESTINIITAIAALWVVVIGNKPADRDHPFGHGKIEHFASAFEGGAIAFAGVIIILQSSKMLFNGPSALQELNTGLMLIVFAGVVNALLGIYLKYIGKKHQSPAIYADGAHVLSDFWTSLGILVGLIAVKVTGLTWLDPVVAILVGALLTYTGFKLLLQSGSELMDSEDRGVLTNLKNLFEQHSFPGIIRMHYTRVMRSGRQHFVDLHLVVPEYWTIEQAHLESERFEAIIIRNYPCAVEIHFHHDPCRVEYCQVCDIEDCELRDTPFSGRHPYTIEELISPVDSIYALNYRGPKSDDVNSPKPQE
ncbi:MAG: cation transporter [Bdellovibrionales bacterium]|jgi:cation diffusion facilitator family transporter|nr:cation transporter [Bdellovibrionales bacterium]MBT3526797.1 cation transporter [Bdellovibrionales bacterium]MBT7669999.1 cation transporter [Bdellovibrionales bacterium]MBT7768269.1 cation transporter [Bdellovibrionales bacterium]